MCELTDTKMIKQAQETHPSILEPLYWALEDALTNDDKKLAKSIYLSFLYMGRYNKAILVQGLQPAYLRRLQEIAFELYGGGDRLVRRRDIALRAAIEPKAIPFAKEKELQDYIKLHPEVLSDAFNDEVRITGTEVQTDFDYRCDITAESKMRFYPIELKIGQGNHQVVSQINKYCHYFYRRLRYNFYRIVQGVVICNGLDAWSVNELRKDGHWCFTIAPSDGGIKLQMVE